MYLSRQLETSFLLTAKTIIGEISNTIIDVYCHNVQTVMFFGSMCAYLERR